MGLPAAQWVKQLRALADESRLRIIELLLKEGLSVSEIAKQLDLSQYNISKHLRVLREADIVAMEAVATRHHYFISSVFRSRLSRMNTLDLGSCELRFNQLLPGRNRQKGPS